MSSISYRAIESALRRLVPGPKALGRGPSPVQQSSLAVRRELDSFRRGQGLPYWHHDHRPD